MERGETAARRGGTHHTARPPDAGTDDEVPGTGIMGDETLVRDADGAGVPGVYPAPPAHTGGAAHPGPGPGPGSNSDSDSEPDPEPEPGRARG